MPTLSINISEDELETSEQVRALIDARTPNPKLTPRQYADIIDRVDRWSEAAGWYDPAKKKFHYLGDDPDIDDHSTMAAELGYGDINGALHAGLIRFFISEDEVGITTSPEKVKDTISFLLSIPVERTTTVDVWGNNRNVASVQEDSTKRAAQALKLRSVGREENPQFRKGHGATFRSGADRSGGALGAESRGLESILSAARRLHTTRGKLEEKSDQANYDSVTLPGQYESHHVKVDGIVRLVEYRSPEAWDMVARMVVREEDDPERTPNGPHHTDSNHRAEMGVKV